MLKSREVEQSGASDGHVWPHVVEQLQKWRENVRRCNNSDANLIEVVIRKNSTKVTEDACKGNSCQK